MAAPTSITISRTKGDTYAEEFTVKDSAGAAIDVTGFSFLLSVDPNPDPSDDTTRLFQITGVLVDAANGRISFAPSALQADQLEPDTYFFDIQQTDGASAVRTIAKGEYIVLPQITQ
jgi:hypothetical protein